MAQPLSWQRALLFGGVIVVGFLVLAESKPGRWLERRVAHPAEFFVRDLLGQGPQKPDNLKIFFFDDKVLEFTQTTDLPLGTWGDLFAALARQNPRAILVDRFFGHPGSYDQADRFISTMAALDVPVATGSFEAGSGERGHAPVAIDRSMYDPENWGTGEDLTWLPLAEGRFYGPHPLVAPGLKHVGHFLYDDNSFGRVTPLFRTSDNRLMPHLSLMAAGSRQLRSGQLFINDHLVPLDEFGQVPLNFVKRERIFGKGGSYSLITYLKRLAKGKPLKEIQQGDVVMLLFNFTGHNDFAESPYGKIEGGLTQVAMTSSVLNGDWLNPLGGRRALMMLLVGFGLVLAMHLRPFAFSVSLLGSMATVVIAGLLVFAYGNYILPWFYPTIAFGTAATFVFVERSRIQAKRSERITYAFAGILPEKRMKEIISNPAGYEFKPCGRTITIMFLDIAGYSRSTERMSPQEAFESLRELLQDIRDCVHRFGGVVDKSLGDGLLCFFGAHYDGTITMRDHAAQAVLCAVEIQRHLLTRNLQAAADKRAIFPVRIGLNTDKAYIGDLGDYKKPDFTIIGDGVNFAQRLEANCEPYGVMIGASCFDRIKGLSDANISIAKRLIKIKHKEEFVEAYELEAFGQDRARKAAVVQAFREANGIERRDNRFPMDADRVLPAYGDVGEGFVDNFSESGLGLVLNCFLARNVKLKVFLGEANSPIRRALMEHNFAPLLVEVRWGRSYGPNQFLHGCLLTNLNQVQLQKLNELLRRFNRDEIGETIEAA